MSTHLKGSKKIHLGLTHLSLHYARFWSMVSHCIQEEVKRLDIKLSTIPANTGAEQAEGLRRLLEQQVDALLIMPVVGGDPDLIAAMEEAKAAGIPVVALNTDGGGQVACLVCSDNAKGQEIVTEYIFEQLGGKGKVAHVQGDLKSPVGIHRSEGFHNVLRQYPNIELVFEAPEDWRQETGARLIRQALAEGPKPEAVIAANDAMALGACDAIEQAGYNGEILVAGFDALPEALLAIQQGQMAASVRQDAQGMARKALEIVLRALRQESFPSIVLTEVELITPDNLLAATVEGLSIMPGILRSLAESHEAQHHLQREIAEAEKLALRRVAEEKLAEERNLLRTLIDTLPDYIYVKDTESRFIISNLAAARSMGLKTPDELVGKTDFDFHLKELAMKYRADEVTVVDSGQPLINYEEPTIDPAGNKIWILSTKVPLHDGQGNIIGLVGMGRDITERKRTEEALAKQATELETVAQVSVATSTILDTAKLLQRVVDLTKESFDLYHVHIYLLNEAGNTLELAAGAGEVGRQMVAKGWSIPLAQEQSLVARAARTRQGVIVNNVREASDWLSNPLLPDTYSELAVPLMVGEWVLGVLDVQADKVGYFTDDDIRIQNTLAAQVAVALENARLFEQAQQEIAERRRAEQALAQQAQALDAELEQIFYVASHHLQEPLRMVVSYSQLLEKRYKSRLDEDADEFIAYATKGAARIRALINDILAFSHVGTHGKHFAPTDVSDILDHTLANLNGVIEEIDAVVTHDDMPTVIADSTQLAQVFHHLVVNTILFRSEHPLEIHIGAEYKDSESQGETAHWVFSVRDNGIGIEPQYFERIFMIFQRLHRPEEYPGTGIGLAICKKIVERHGGRIWVESKPGEGSTFYFTLPDRGDNS
jgi:PAS domain S-box-containing protein